MRQTKGAIGNLLNRYRAVLKKCHLLNVFGSLAVAGALMVGGTNLAYAAGEVILQAGETYTNAEDYIYSDNSVNPVVAQAHKGQSSSLTLSGQNISISTIGEMASGQRVGVWAYGNTTSAPSITLGSEQSKNSNITINVQENNAGSIGIWAYGRYSSDQSVAGGNVTINADTLIVNTSGSTFSYGIYSQNSTTNAKNGVSKIIINANNTYVDTSTNAGAPIVAMSQGQMEINGNLYVNTLGGTTTDAIIARGGAVININKDGSSEVQLKGNINFNYDYATSRTGVDADVNITLSGSNSWWEGNTLVEWAGSANNPTAPEKTVSGMKLIIKDNATWRPTNIETVSENNNGQTYLPLNNTELANGNIDVANNVSINLENISGNGSLTNSGSTTFRAGNLTDLKVSNNGNLSLASGMNTTITEMTGSGSLNNAGTLNFSGEQISAENSAITNTGTITIASGATSLGSYTQSGGSFTVKSGASLTNSEPMQINAGAVTFEDDSTYAVNAQKLSDTTPAIALSNNASLSVAQKAKLVLNNAVAGQVYNVIDNQGTGTADEWSPANISASSDLVQFSMDEEGNVRSSAADASEVFPNLDGELATYVTNFIANGLNDTESARPGVRFLSRATDNNYLGSDKAAAVEQIESAARIAVAGAVPQMTKMASDSATNAVVNRLGLANPNGGVQAINADGQLVAEKAQGLALWIAPLWQNQRGFGMEAGNLDYGYSANLGGVSLGADYTFENAIRAGLMFHIGGGYAESKGDLYETTNSMSFWGIGAYGGWEYNNFAVMADVSYTSTWNNVKQDLDYRMGMGSELEADIQAAAISAGLRFEYKLETSVLDLIPHVGVRYMNIRTWGYDVDSNAGTVLEGDGFNQNIWTFPVGVTVSKDIAMNNGWSFKPSVDFTVIPAAGDIKAKEDVRFTGVPGSYELETQMMDYLTWQGGVGVEFGNDTVSIGLNYTLQAGQNSTGHGVFGMFRYEF